MPRFQEDQRAHNIEVVSKFRTFAENKGVTVSQLALAWLLKQGDDIFPIPGTRKIAYLEENWATLDVVLSDEEEKEIREFGEVHQLAGECVPKRFESYLFRDTREE